jgi:hypothetical protein
MANHIKEGNYAHSCRGVNDLSISNGEHGGRGSGGSSEDFIGADSSYCGVVYKDLPST